MEDRLSNQHHTWSTTHPKAVNSESLDKKDYPDSKDQSQQLLNKSAETIANKWSSFNQIKASSRHILQYLCIPLSQPDTNKTIFNYFATISWVKQSKDIFKNNGHTVSEHISIKNNKKLISILVEFLLCRKWG